MTESISALDQFRGLIAEVLATEPPPSAADVVAWKSGREPVLNLLANMGADVLQRDPQDVPAMILLTIAIAGIEDMERKVSACVN